MKIIKDPKKMQALSTLLPFWRLKFYFPKASDKQSFFENIAFIPV